jgi:hypothetical protein
VTNPYARLRFRVLLDDGVVLVDELVHLTDLPEAPERHGDLSKAYLDAGYAVTLEATDPDGIIDDVRLRIDPPPRR